jgi:hypothetical protein
MVGLPPSGYRITAHDGHLASCDGNKQALAPVGVPPRRLSTVSYLGAFYFNWGVSSNRKYPNRHNFAEKLVSRLILRIDCRKFQDKSFESNRKSWGQFFDKVMVVGRFRGVPTIFSIFRRNALPSYTHTLRVGGGGRAARGCWKFLLARQVIDTSFEARAPA